jgi:hypothetical protein
VESELGLLGTSASNWPFVPVPGDCEDGEFGGMKIGRGNRSTLRKPAPAPLCTPQIPLDQTRARTRAAAVGSQRLTARPQIALTVKFIEVVNYNGLSSLRNRLMHKAIKRASWR